MTEWVSDGSVQIELSAPTYAVVDLRRDDGCGLGIIIGSAVYQDAAYAAHDPAMGRELRHRLRHAHLGE